MASSVSDCLIIGSKVDAGRARSRAQWRIGVHAGTQGEPDRANQTGLFARRCDRWLLN
jgi:hypothetical protein